MRIPVGVEGGNVAKFVNEPENYLMPCYLGLSYPADDKVVVKQNMYKAEDKIHINKW